MIISTLLLCLAPSPFPRRETLKIPTKCVLYYGYGNVGKGADAPSAQRFKVIFHSDGRCDWLNEYGNRWYWTWKVQGKNLYLVERDKAEPNTLLVEFPKGLRSGYVKLYNKKSEKGLDGNKSRPLRFSIWEE